MAASHTKHTKPRQRRTRGEGSIYETGLEPASLDVAYSRWLMVHLQRPVEAMRAIYTALIWATAEGFGGPYVPGISTDVGAAIISSLLFLTLLINDAGAGFSRFSLDSVLERESTVVDDNCTAHLRRRALRRTRNS